MMASPKEGRKKEGGTGTIRASHNDAIGLSKVQLKVMKIDCSNQTVNQGTTTSARKTKKKRGKSQADPKMGELIKIYAL
jgi:hypothetical protein